MDSINVQTIWILSALDKLISENKKNPALVCQLFEKKEMVIQLLQSGKIDAHKYKNLVGKAYKEDSGIVKACAQQDMVKLKDPKDEKIVQAWFKQMIDSTGISYENQKKLYQYYKGQQAPSNQQSQSPPTVQPAKQTQPVQPPPKTQQIKKVVPPPVEKPKEIIPPKEKPKEGPKQQIQSGPNIEQLVSFKSLDSALDECEGPIERYQKLLERKKKLLGLVDQKQMTAQKYKATLELYCNRLGNNDLATDYRFELDGITDFCDGNVAEWFSEIIEQAKDSLDNQIEKLTALKKGPSSGQKAKPSYRQSVHQSAIGHKKQQSEQFDIGQMNSFKVIDEQLQLQLSNKANYKALLEKKKKMIDLAKKGNLTGQKYKSLLVKSIAETRNEEIKDSMKFQFQELGQFHGGNLSAWWQEIISNSEMILEDQEKIMADLNAGKKIEPKNSDDFNEEQRKLLYGDDGDDGGQNVEVHISDDEDLGMSVQPAQKQTKATPPPQKKEVAPSPPPAATGKLFDCSQIFSLKALDQLMAENQSNGDHFCALFQQKQAIFGKMQKGEIDASKYKTLQEKGLSSSSMQKVKDCIQMDLLDLKQMNSGNVQEWFESLINDAGLDFEDQQEKYSKFKAKGNSVSSGVKQQTQPQKTSKATGEIKATPAIAEVVSFTAVAKLFAHCIKTTDYLYYKELCSKREKLIDLVSQGRLIAGKYKDINKAAMSKTENQFLRCCIEEELDFLSGKFKGNEEQWFQALKKYLIQTPPELKTPENPEMKRVNELPAKKKVEYLAKRMAPYESLVAYYKDNKIEEENPTITNYVKAKKEGFKAISMLVKDQTLDIFNLAQKLYPPISTQIFYGGNLTALRKKAEQSAGYFVQQAAALKDYSTKIKKSTNTKNLEAIKTEVAACESNIAFLRNWPGKELVAFPVITQEKIEKYNLDLNTHLDKNEVEIIIKSIEGLQEKSYLRIYAGAAEKERFQAKVENGPQKDLKVVVKLTPQEATDLFKGEKPVIMVRLFEKGFWGSMSLVGECALLGTFIRHNIVEEKASTARHLIVFQMRVYKPTKPLITEITHTTIKQFPAFKVDPEVEKQIVKECYFHFKE